MEGLFAARRIQKGETVLIAEPYAWAVYEQKKDITCRHCMREVDGNVLSLRCTRCKEVWYCSRGCQQRDRRVHRADECAVLRNWELDPEHYTNETIAEMKLMVRVLSRKAHESSETEEGSPPVCPNPAAPPLPTLRYADYCQLVSGKEDFPEDAVENLNYWVCDYVAKLRQWMGRTEEAAEILDIMLRNRRNSFYVAATSGHGAAGCAVYVTPSFFNHACTPNVIYCSYPDPGHPRHFEYVVDQDVPCSTELCISYLDDDARGLSCPKRRSLLQDAFLFRCTCARCSDDDLASRRPP